VRSREFVIVSDDQVSDDRVRDIQMSVMSTRLVI